MYPIFQSFHLIRIQISDSYTSNYSTFFQYGSSASSSAYPASPSSAPPSPSSLVSSTSSTHHLTSSQNGHLPSQTPYGLSSSQNGTPEDSDLSPSAKHSAQVYISFTFSCSNNFYIYCLVLFIYLFFAACSTLQSVKCTSTEFSAREVTGRCSPVTDCAKGQT
jgi:hypothetical protein